jgi:hypothetical protein
MIAEKNRAAKAKPRIKITRQREWVAATEPLRGFANSARLVGAPTAAGSGAMHAQASLLCDPRFSVVQRQALARPHER